MKRFLTTWIIIYAFLFGFASLARASDTSKATEVKGKWDPLNSLKSIHSHLMNNGHIVRLEFKSPVSQWMKPVFYKKLVEIDFPGAFVGTVNQSIPLKNPIISKVFASQSDSETLRVSFQIKPDLKDIKERVKLLQQGRFVIIRFDIGNTEPSFIFPLKGLPEKKQKGNYIKTDEDLLSPFLPQESKKMKDKEEGKLSKLNANNFTLKDTQKEALVIEKEGKKKEKHVESSVAPLVDQIKKGIIVLGIIFLMIFGFKKYFLINTRRRIRSNEEIISLGSSKRRGDKIFSVVYKGAIDFLNYLIRIIKPKEAQLAEDAKEKVLQNFRKIKKVRRL